MQHATQVALLNKVLALAERGASDGAEQPSSLPVSVYLDEARYRRERDEVLLREPVLVARSGEIPKGAFLTRELMVPLLLTRDEQGRLRAFLNVCKHRGTQLVGEASGRNRDGRICRTGSAAAGRRWRGYGRRCAGPGS